jgi:hypothetical protein
MAGQEMAGEGAHLSRPPSQQAVAIQRGNACAGSGGVSENSDPSTLQHRASTPSAEALILSFTLFNTPNPFCLALFL